jgi:hypothetical protein
MYAAGYTVLYNRIAALRAPLHAYPLELSMNGQDFVMITREDDGKYLGMISANGVLELNREVTDYEHGLLLDLLRRFDATIIKIGLDRGVCAVCGQATPLFSVGKITL